MVIRTLCLIIVSSKHCGDPCKHGTVGPQLFKSPLSEPSLIRTVLHMFLKIKMLLIAIICLLLVEN